MQSTFEFLSAQNLLEEFVQKTNVLQFLEKEDLVCLIEQLLSGQQHADLDKNENLPNIEKDISEKLNFVVDDNYRQNVIKYTHQEVLNKLNQDGVIPFGSFSKRDLNKLAKKLNLIFDRYDTTGRNKQWFPTREGANIGISQRSVCAVSFSIEAYEVIKNYLLSK